MVYKRGGERNPSKTKLGERERLEQFWEDLETGKDARRYRLSVRRWLAQRPLDDLGRSAQELDKLVQSMAGLDELDFDEQVGKMGPKLAGAVRAGVGFTKLVQREIKLRSLRRVSLLAGSCAVTPLSEAVAELADRKRKKR